MANLVVGINDLWSVNPEIAAQWHPTKNGLLTPEHVTAGLHKKVWWECKNDPNSIHEWETAINSRAKGNGCPFCSGRAILVGYNDLGTTNLALAEQWHPTKNGSLTPEQVTAGSTKKIWWNCTATGSEHEWESAVMDRSSGRGCPICAGQAILVGYNDLGTTNLALAEQWHPTRNGSLTSEQVTAGSGKKVWWECKRDSNSIHEWEAAINSRSKGNNCPICAGQAILVGYNDLRTANLALAEQWHPTRNGPLTPEQVTAGSKRKVWWECKNYSNSTHEWEAAINSRARGLGCPFCAGKKILSGYNDLRTTNLVLADEWHPTRNGSLTSEQVTAGSSKKVWWECKNDPNSIHEWEATIIGRSMGNSCPFCMQRAILVGYNDLGTTNSKIVEEWHPTRNGSLTSEQVTAGSSKKVWWICTVTGANHEWEAAINSRTRGIGCPFCAGKKVLSGHNDLKTSNPKVASEWHPTRNGSLTPEQVSAGSSKKVWWICTVTGINHEWEVSINCRTNARRGNGCPFCAGKKVLRGYNDLRTTNLVIAEQWHPTKNRPLAPEQVTAGSGARVWWECKNDPNSIHEWKTAVKVRSGGSGCPKCSASKTEKTFRDSFERETDFIFPSSRIRLERISRATDQAQIDMLNSILGLVIEYDGAWAHGENSLLKNTLKQKLLDDKETTEALVKLGYNVIRIRDHDRNQKLPPITIDPTCEKKVYQVTYKSFGKDKHVIDDVVKEIIAAKSEWFMLDNDNLLQSE